MQITECTIIITQCDANHWVGFELQIVAGGRYKCVSDGAGQTRRELGKLQHELMADIL